MAATFRQSNLQLAVSRKYAPVAPTARRVLHVKATMQPSTGVGLSPELRKTIDHVITTNKVVVFMKGHKTAPKCGFSNSVCQILRSMNVTFESVNILEDERLRSGMKEYSMWPTFPQVYIGGEFVGGADIMIEMYKSGELAELLERELNS